MANSHKEFSADLCVIGTGPAAYAILDALARTRANMSVLFLEGASGSCPPLALPEPSVSGPRGSRRTRHFVTDTQDLYEGSVDGWIATAKPDYLRESRVSALGGTGTAWTGWLCPLWPKRIEAEAHRDWPIPPDELAAHAASAMTALGLPPLLLDGDHIRTLAGLPGLPPAALEKHGFVEGHVILAAFDFRRQFLARLSSCDQAKLLSNARVVDFRVSGAAHARAVEACTVVRKGEDGRENQLLVRAGVFVVAAGALETTRLLLASDLAASLPRLGAGFVEHPYLWDGGRARLAQDAGDRVRYFSPNPVALPGGVGMLPLVARAGGRRGSTLPIRFVTGGLHQAPGTINASWETLCGPQAHVRLQPHLRDRLGVPQLELVSGPSHQSLRLSEVDRAVQAYLALLRDAVGVWEAHHAPFSEPLARWPASYRISPGNHPAGTCRMSHDIDTGVVDPECRVHGVENLYLASSAVFPSSGYANPTLTIMALADRLALHLAAGSPRRAG